MRTAIKDGRKTPTLHGDVKINIRGAFSVPQQFLPMFSVGISVKQRMDLIGSLGASKVQMKPNWQSTV